MQSLTKDLKKTVGLLATGTFLEYFDLMLYVHMAVLLNNLFYPATDPHSVALLGAFAFCTTFVFRPLGALVFGWIGDNYGRKPVMIITTFIMGASCIIMANLPTYAQIGFGASILMTLCRIMQSLSSTGEVTSCELYLMELTKPPIQYPVLGVVPFFAALGGTFALGISSIVTTSGLSWRIAFYIGAGVAFIGIWGRATLKETPEFANIKIRINKISENFSLSNKEIEEILNIKDEKAGVWTLIWLFVIQCIFPLYYYFAYIYCGNIFKTIFNYTTEDVIHQNFFLSLFDLARIYFLSWISYYIHPLKILKVQLAISSIFVICCPFLLNIISTSYQLGLIQIGIMVFSIHGLPAIPIFYKHIPVLKRFKNTGLTYAVGRAAMFAITSFGLVFLIEWFGYLGILLLFIPCLIAYAFALFYFDRLEKTAITNKPTEEQNVVLEPRSPGTYKRENYLKRKEKLKKKKLER